MRFRVSYSVIKMAAHQGYATNTHHIPVDFFIGMIEGRIKKLIHTYGHKNCGLRHEELCKEIKKIISDNKKIVFQYMDPSSKIKWTKEWDSRRRTYFNKLFDEEGFINMCFPFKNIVHQDLYQLQSRHVNFCIEKDKRRLALGKSPEYNACKEYNEWIIAEEASFTSEYLRNVKIYKINTVKKFFITKKHPEGYNPLTTYHGIKLDCEIYNPESRRYQPIQVENIPPKILHPPIAPGVRKESRGKVESSMPDRGGRIEKTKFNVKQPPEKKTPPDSLTSPLPNKKVDGTPNGHGISVKSKVSASLDNVEGPKKETTPMHHQPPTGIPPTAQEKAPPLPFAKGSNLPHVIHDGSSPIATTSSSSIVATVKDTTSSKTPVSTLNSGSPLPSNLFTPAADTKGLDSAPQPSTISGTRASTHPKQSVLLTAPADSSLLQPQSPVLTVSPAVTTSEGPGTLASSSASTVTTTATTILEAPDSVTISAMGTTAQPSTSSIKQAPDIPRIPEDPPVSSPDGTEKTTPPIDPSQAPLSLTTPSKGSPATPVKEQTDKDTEKKSAADASSNAKDPIQATDNPLSKDAQQTSENTSKTQVTIPDSNVQRTPNHRDQQISRTAVQQPSNIGLVLSPSDKTGHAVNTPVVHTNTPSMVDSTVRTNKNDNTSIIPEGIPPLTHIIPTLLVILGTLTLLFQLYKYTPFGFLLGRKRKREKQDLKRIFETPEKPTYESTNITMHEWEDPNLVGKVVQNDVYIKLLKINRYKQEMQKRKKKNKKTLIEVHMEVLEEYKNDDWELHKGDFLEICLRGFINDENDDYSKLPNTELTINNINEKTIEDIQKQEILWNNWIENHRNILEQWKKEEWFHILKNKWKNEEQKYKEKNDKLQENILNEQETHSIVSQKDIWKQWISKQATLIKMFNQEDWFKELVDEQNKEKNNYHTNEYNNISVTSKTEFENEKTNDECGRSKNIIQKLMVQIHMMVLEECIKDEIIRNKEMRIDNFIEDIHNQNNYDQKRNVPQCDTDNFNVLKYDEIHTSKNK
ncbi:STP1 protein [Plasmodium ovale wallikeri]|uniref:STP1 protein n=1 Tax=Plasmodium ovale wallikeri TaxID=864142 RepID=A0A1A9AMK0_PLAOA|nr:STP1 protein [Plasmodium ovale wallikeri]